MALSVLESKAKENYEVAESIKDTKRNSAISRYYYACLLTIKYYLISNGIVTEADIVQAKKNRISTHKFLIGAYLKSFKDHKDFRSYNNNFRKIESIRDARNRADYDDVINYSSSSFSREYNIIINDVRAFIIILRNYCSAPF